MKMVLAVVQADDAPAIMDALVAAGHRVTRIATTGGWLRRENVTLLIGVTDRMVNHVLQVLQRKGRHRTTQLNLPLEVPWAENAEMTQIEVGGATVFVFDVEQFEQL
jgi:uncharacterized protein YaaQ